MKNRSATIFKVVITESFIFRSIVAAFAMQNIGTIEQNLPQPFPKVLFSHSGRSGNPREHAPLVLGV